MWFNNRGPVPISDDDLNAYQNFFPAQPTFQMLYRTWTDEHYDDAIRRLCLRDMVWQSPDKISDKNDCYYETDEGSHTAMFRCASLRREVSQGKEHLAAMLKMRPKLLNELVEEFLWVPSAEETRKYGVGQRRGKKEDEMIEFLLPLVDMVVGHRLWQHHSKSHGDQNRIARLDIWETMAGQPAWLDFNLMDDLRKGLQQEINTNIEALTEHHHFLDLPQANQDQLSLFLQVTRVVEAYKHTTPHKDLTHFIELVRMLNAMLPEGFRYLTFSTLTHVLPYLRTKEYIIKTARRHLMNADDPTGMWQVPKVEALNFLYWLYGIVSLCASDDPKFAQRIKYLIRIACANPQKFAKDSRKAVLSAKQFPD